MLNAGGRQLSGNQYVGDAQNTDNHFQQMRERSSNNPRLIGSLGAVDGGNTVHRRDFSSNTHNSGGGQGQN
jgi:hypothetical protein